MEVTFNLEIGYSCFLGPGVNYQSYTVETTYDGEDFRSFAFRGEALPQEILRDRYRTLIDAINGHERMVAHVKRIAEDDWAQFKASSDAS